VDIKDDLLDEIELVWGVSPGNKGSIIGGFHLDALVVMELGICKRSVEYLLLPFPLFIDHGSARPS